jgi:NAD(P)-dependent dehydrogenase (short-subunit alcohol dehydrogenase family)
VSEGFEGRSVLVVGGGGVGAEVCREVAAAGGDVYFTYNRKQEQAEALAASIASERLAGFGQLDISDPAAVEALVAGATDALGGRIDAVVTTAGYLHELTFFTDVDLATMEKTLRIELFGVMYVVKAVLPGMIERDYGRIVTVGSDSGKVGSKAEASSAAARGGIISFSKAVAREVARHDICLNVVCPGPTETPLLESMLDDDGVSGKLMNAMVRAIPKRRAGTAAEVSGMTTFLASERASYITGQAISVSGGLTMA